MIESVFKLLGAGLSIWDNKERTKYQRKFMKLKEDYYDESNKDRPDHAVLDNLEWKLQLLSKTFATSVEKSQTTDM